MIRFFYVLYYLVLFPVAANAASISSSSILNASCSGALISSLLDGASFSCAGNLTLDGGFITSDSMINITADGDLLLDNIALTAPNIMVSVLSGMMAIGNGVVLNGSSVNFTSNGSVVNNGVINIRESILNIGGKTLIITDPNFVINPGRNVILQTPVPEPSAFALILVGLGLISLRRMPA